MKVEGTYSFSVDREKVWDSLLDPEILAGCIPGSESFVPVGENSYEIVLKIKIAAFTGTYRGSIKLVDMDHPHAYRMLVEGKGSGGSVRGEALMTFAQNGTGTEVSVLGDVRVTGMVARVGQRLMGGASRMLMNQFFTCLQEKIEN